MKDWYKSLCETALYKKFRQFIRFGIVGAANFLVSLIVYSLVLFIFSRFPGGYHSGNRAIYFFFRYDYQVANILGFILSVLNAYFLNRIWVFKKEAKTASKGAVFRFFASYTFTFFLSSGLAWVWVEAFFIAKAFVPFLNAAIMTPVNYFLSKYFSFRNSKKHLPGVELLPYDEEENEMQ